MISLLSLLSRIKTVVDRLWLNLFAMLGAFLGLANAGLAWHLYGASVDADIWMLSLVVVQTLCLLSQLGVEQFAVFSAEAHAFNIEIGRRFDRDGMSWALALGLLCCILFGLITTPLIGLFAQGYSEEERSQVAAISLALLLQVLFSPSLYVLRQQLLLQNHYRLSIISNILFGSVQMIVLLTAWLFGHISMFHIALSTGLLSAVIAAWFVFKFCEDGVMKNMPDWARLWPFIRASVALRFTHSIHNFFVVLLSNSALSGGVEGTVAVYQYAKKIADGLSSISISPHLTVYHSAQAKAWVRGDLGACVVNIRTYLLTAYPLLLGLVVVFVVFTSLAINVIPDFGAKLPQGGALILFVLLAWQTLISLESVPVGILVIDKRAGLILMINTVFIITFFMALHWVLVSPYTALAVAIVSICCQAISTLLFSIVAFKLWRYKFNHEFKTAD